MALPELEEKMRSDEFFRRILGERSTEDLARDPQAIADYLCEKAKEEYEWVSERVAHYELLREAFVAFTIVIAAATLVLIVLGVLTAAVASSIVSVASSVLTLVLGKVLGDVRAERDKLLAAVKEYCAKSKLMAELARLRAPEEEVRVLQARLLAA